MKLRKPLDKIGLDWLTFITYQLQIVFSVYFYLVVSCWAWKEKDQNDNPVRLHNMDEVKDT